MPGALKLEAPRIRDVEPMKLTGLMGDFTPETMRDIAALWPRFMEQLPASGRTAALGGGAPDFLERHGEHFDPAGGTGDLEVWYPIRP